MPRASVWAPLPGPVFTELDAVAQLTGALIVEIIAEPPFDIEPMPAQGTHGLRGPVRSVNETRKAVGRESICAFSPSLSATRPSSDSR